MSGTAPTLTPPETPDRRSTAGISASSSRCVASCAARMASALACSASRWAALRRCSSIHPPPVTDHSPLAPLARSLSGRGEGEGQSQLPLKRLIQHTRQQRVEFRLRLRLQRLQRIDLSLEAVEVGHDEVLFFERRKWYLKVWRILNTDMRSCQASTLLQYLIPEIW